MDEFLEGVIVEHMETSKREGGIGESFVGILLDLHNEKDGDIFIDRESFEALLVDLLGAGTDTLTTLLIWTMAELLQHPIGLDFEFIPFGEGRRGCPGIGFSAATVEFVLANLVWKFDWELPNGGKSVDMAETPAATLHKAVPLLAVANKYS
ncbi:hypothetical protein SASPL_131895 [Salvia splendens]|uniref:Uncharacterized protein n=1 Tax=Salvia splendens TaxID=180675 RepID=A0A8X8ZM10_SALSN|nr:hypothetical protein SASPL_131895 [Salvia splendens]